MFSEKTGESWSYRRLQDFRVPASLVPILQLLNSCNSCNSFPRCSCRILRGLPLFSDCSSEDECDELLVREVAGVQALEEVQNKKTESCLSPDFLSPGS